MLHKNINVKQNTTLKSIYPNFEIIANLRYSDGETVDQYSLWAPFLKTVAAAFPDSSDIKPKVILSPAPVLNAGASNEGEGTIFLYAGIPLWFMYLPNVTSYLYNLCGPGKESPINSIKNAAFPIQCKNELDKLGEALITSKNSKWTTCGALPKGDMNWDIYDYLVQIIVLHETGHLEERSQHWSEMMSRTENYLIEMLNNSNLITDNFVFEKNILVQWCREAIADQLAFANLWFGDRKTQISQENRGLINLSFGILFGIMELVEWVFPPEEYTIYEFSTHPPTRLRRDLFHYILSKEFGLDINRYYCYQNGAGFMAGILFDKYFNSKYGNK